jgi:glycosyltransferase involved in cell wall biosynthesis
MVITDYVEHIEELYALSDCYVFPTNPKDRTKSIEGPLSVLEAMSCNLPVITTRFGALPRMFGESHDGLFFVDGDEDIPEIIDLLKTNRIKIKTREAVSSYSWERIGSRLNDIYIELINEQSHA